MLVTVSDALRIEQRLLEFVSGRQRKERRREHHESPREIEQRAMEKLYGGRPTVVVRTEHEADDDSA
jgi:hypothetical protein